MRQVTPLRPPDTISYLTVLVREQQTGEALFQSGPNSGKVYLNRGLVLWAFATGQDESFQSILIKENLISKERLLQGIKEARETGRKNLDDILQILGVQDSATRSSIVERHTKAALRVIGSWRPYVAQFNQYPPVAGNSFGGMQLEKLVDAELLRSEQAQPPVPAEEPQEPQPQHGSVPRMSYKNDLHAVTVTSIPEVLERLRQEVPHFIAAMLIDGSTGMPISVLSDAEELDIEAVSAFYRDLSRSALDALRAMGKSFVGGCPLEEVLITGKDDYVLLRVLNNADYILYLLVDKESNPAMARLVLRRYLEQLQYFVS